MDAQTIADFLNNLQSLSEAGSRLILGWGLTEYPIVRSVLIFYVYAISFMIVFWVLFLFKEIIKIATEIRAGVAGNLWEFAKSFFITCLFLCLLAPAQPGSLAVLGIPSLLRTDPVIQNSPGSLATIEHARLPTFWWLVYGSYRLGCEVSGYLASSILNTYANIAETLANPTNAEQMLLTMSGVVVAKSPEKIQEECSSLAGEIPNWCLLLSDDALRNFMRELNLPEDVVTRWTENNRSILDNLFETRVTYNEYSSYLNRILSSPDNTAKFLSLPIIITLSSEIQNTWQKFLAARIKVINMAIWKALKEAYPDLPQMLQDVCSKNPKYAICVADSGGLQDTSPDSFTNKDLLALGAGSFLKPVSEGLNLVTNVSSWVSGLVSRATSVVTGFLGRLSIYSFLAKGASYLAEKFFASFVWNMALAATFYLGFLLYLVLVMTILFKLAFNLPIRGFAGKFPIWQYFLQLGGIIVYPLALVIIFSVILYIRGLFVDYIVPIILVVTNMGTPKIASAPFISTFWKVFLGLFKALMYLSVVLGLSGFIARAGYIAYQEFTGVAEELPDLRIHTPFTKS